MANPKEKCIIILSSKSSGSSALLRILSSFPQVKRIRSTRHYEFETLYWVKAASLLGLPQVNMIDSEVPIAKEKAKSDLLKLLNDNLDCYSAPQDEAELIFGGWKLLCKQYGPIFIEKSPHHLHQWSALELIRECMRKQPEIDFLLVGLVRNPMAMLYSSWDRMRTVPEANQYEWMTAYDNLLRFKGKIGDKMVVIRYEDMVKTLSCLKKVFDFIGVNGVPLMNESFHPKSMHKWRNDQFYGFQLSAEVVDFAKKFGYCEEELKNQNSFLWNIYRELPSGVHKVIRRIRRKRSL
jgi:hypothetical protein